MNKDSEKIINLINSTVNLLSHTLENVVADVEDNKLKNYFCELLNKFEVISNDCKMILKADNKEIDKLGFLEKAQNLISIKLSNPKQTREHAKIFYLNCCEFLPDLYFAKSDLTLCENEEKSSIINLIELIETSIDKMKEFF